MIISRSSRDKEKIIYPVFSSMLVFNLAWDCTGFVHLVKITVNLNMHLPCYIQKKMFSRLKHSFWPFFCSDPWALSKSGIAIYAPFFSLLLFTPWLLWEAGFSLATANRSFSDKEEVLWRSVRMCIHTLIVASVL